MKNLPAKNQAEIPEGMNRRGFLRTVGGAAAFAAAYGFVNIPFARAQAATTSKRNLLLIISDQERAIQWFPDGWAAANLPNYTALCNRGVLFDHCCTNTAMCSPSRNTMFTGLFPAQHQSFDTLTEGFQQSETEHQLDPTLPNFATVLKAAGYEVVYKGKWHMSKGVDASDGTFISDDIERYGFDLWDPLDAGQDTNIANYGGGTANNDQRYINDAVAYLQGKAADPDAPPFCLVLSLVNPHDVLGYPGNGGAGGYGPEWLVGDLGLPPTVHEDLLSNFKPTCQEELLVKLNGLGPLVNDQMKTNYMNFYGNLLKHVDSQLGQVLGAFSEELRAKTWIVRTSDHGEMGMCHGGQRQKSFNCYEETLRVPLIWSNPVDFPTGRTCSELVSHVDLLPTICAMLGVDGWEGYNFSGIDYSSLIKEASASVVPNYAAVQDYLLFTWDDIWAGQNAAGNPQGIVPPPNRIQAIRQKYFKYARYFDGEGVQADQGEFYDLRPASLGGTDVDADTGQPVELINLSIWAEALRIASGLSTLATLEQTAIREGMASELQQVVTVRLQPRPAESAVPPENFQSQTVTWTDDDGVEQSAIQITWVSRSTTQYQLQQSTDGLTWTNVGDVILGTNGPILISEPANSLRYRLAWSAVGQDIPQPKPYVAAPTIKVSGGAKRKIRGTHLTLKGNTNTPGNRIEYRIGGEGNRIGSKTTSGKKWSISILGLDPGRSNVYVRARNSVNAVTGWKKIVVDRVK